MNVVYAGWCSFIHRLSMLIINGKNAENGKIIALKVQMVKKMYWAAELESSG